MLLITNYLNIFIFFLCAVVFSCLLYLINYILYSLKKGRYQSRHSFKTYEFGTTTIGNAQTLSNSHFFTLSVLFIMFDIEIFFMYIWVAGLSSTTNLLYKLSFIFFISVLFITLVYELSSGALNWYRKKLY